MKKNRDSSELAARIAAAASQPVGTKSAPAAAAHAPMLVSSTPAATVPATAPPRSKPKKTKPEQDTVPITLRPTGALLSKFVLKASERAREEGRVISAQKIMLEALERTVL